jgi:group I intron endonuclease
VAVVYLIEDLSNGFSYVGKTIRDPREYWGRHVWAAARGSSGRTLLYPAIRAHGVDNFRFTVVEYCDTDEQASLAEIYWIDRLQLNRKRHPNGYGYNLTDGGDGAAGGFASDETRRKMSLARTGVKKRPMSEEGRRNISAARKGKAKANSGSFAKGNSGWTGRHHSDDTRRRISDARRGKATGNSGSFKPGDKRRLGIKHSEETKRKISEARRRRAQ